MSGLAYLKKTVIACSHILCRLPEKPGRALAAAMGIVAWQAWHNERRRIENCIDRIYFRMHRQPPQPVSEIVRRAFLHFSLVAYEVLRFPVLSRSLPGETVILRGRDIIDRELEKGRGVILVLPHIGNWEILGAAIVQAGYPLNSFYLAQKEDEIGGLLDHFRAYSGIVLHDRDRGGIRALRALKNGEILGMIGDQDGSRNGVYMNFLGHWVSMPAGPANWSLKTGAGVLPLYSLRRGLSPVFDAAFLPPINEDRPGDYNGRVIARTLAVARWMEELILQHPEQYLWFYDRFKPRHEGWLAAEKLKNGQMYHGEPRYGS
jgi:KDO2-lipid IV(A) lauroyltransferase